MAKPGFYNDNQYRDYPFIAQPALAQSLPTSSIVDAGFIMGYDAEYDDATGAVFLREVRRDDMTVSFVFSFSGGERVTLLTFTAPITNIEYTTVFQDAAPAQDTCGDEPIWGGFIVLGPATDLLAALDNAGGRIEFNDTRYVIEPARIQNLNKAYLRAINVGNVTRVIVPTCDDTANDAPGQIITATCLQGAIKFEEGYQTSIAQNNRDNALVFSGVLTGGDRSKAELCENNGELPFYAAEIENKPYIHGQVGDVPARRSEFLSGGWACKDLIFTLNGIGGSNVNIVGGTNIQVGYDDARQAITLALAENARGRCNG